MGKGKNVGKKKKNIQKAAARLIHKFTQLPVNSGGVVLVLETLALGLDTTYLVLMIILPVGDRSRSI